MPGTIANVLVGVAELGIRQPNDALAEWSDAQKQVGSYSAKLTKTGSGNAGSTHVQFTPPTGTTLTAFVAGIITNSFYHMEGAAGVVGNFAQFEFKFEDPDSNAWMEFTVVNRQGKIATGGWVKETLATTDLVGWGGVGEEGVSFFDWDLGDTVADVITSADALPAVTSCGEWLLTRVRVELWESSPARHVYIDSIEVMGVTYTIEPGGTAPALVLSSPFVAVGYTEDGVEIEYTPEETDIDVAEETFSINRVLTKEVIEVRCNMAEASLANINNAMAGGVLATSSIITFGDGVNKTMNLRIKGTNPAGFIREIIIPKASCTGAVAMGYKKDEKTIVPITFQALKPATGKVCTIVDNAT